LHLQKIKFRNMLALYCRKIIIIVVFCVPAIVNGQMNAQEYESRSAINPYHFGIALSFNKSDYTISFSDQFSNHDSVMVVESTSGPGFNLGIISSLRLGKYFDLRFVPSLSFAEKTLNYTYRDESTSFQTLESLYLDLPFDIKFKSAAYKDMKVYVLGGIKYAYDFSSNAEARNADGQVRVLPNDLAVNCGFGFEFYFPFFIFSPEIKLSNGIINLHKTDPLLQESYVIDKLFSRTILFTIHIEG